METTSIPNFSSEEEREKFIGGNRETRILLEKAEMETALSKLDDLSQLINEKTQQITAFYYTLNERLSRFELGYSFILKDEQDEQRDYRYRLCHFEDAAGDAFFWRLGYFKMGGSWCIVCHLYKVEYAKHAPVEGPDPRHIWLEDQAVRLTHASRDLRIQASHVIADFVQKFVRQVAYNESMVCAAAQRIEKLEELVL